MEINVPLTTRAMQIIEVNDKTSIEAFRKLPYFIYRGHPHWIPHVRQDVEEVFDPSKNKTFRHGTATRWILLDDVGMTIGRIAAFINDKLAHTHAPEAGGIGFFECIDDQSAATLLFDTAREWLVKRGRSIMDGPINFGEKDKYWGLLVEGFDRSPSYGQTYNPEYYQALFKAYGFELYYKQFIFFRPLKDPLEAKFVARASRLSSDSHYRCEHLKLSQLDRFTEEFRTVYNRAWSKHLDFQEMPMAQAKHLMNKLRPIADEELMWFVYYRDRPVGFYISLPEINEIIQRVGDNLNTFGKLKFWIHKQLGACKTSYGVAFGMDPDHQGKGVEGLLFQRMAEVIQGRKKYDGVLMTWIGDFNPKMIAIVQGLGATRVGTLATWRKHFDRNIPFERYPLLDR